MKQVVILAGGKGTRLRERVGDLPKPLVDIGGAPLLEHHVAFAKQYEFSHVLILVNYQAKAIADYCASRQHWGLNVSLIDDGQPRGTAGAVLAAFDALADEFLVVYGDTMLDVDLERFYSFHRSSPDTAATLFLHPNDHPFDSDLVDVDDDGLVSGFYPYPRNSERYLPNLVNAALYWMDKRSVEPWRYQQGRPDFVRDLFPSMLARGLRLVGYRSPEYIKDCGTPSRLDKVRADFQSGKIQRSRLDSEQVAVFVDRDGTINHEVNHLSEPNQFELLPGVEVAIRRLNQSEYRCCVVSNQPVVARGECSIPGLHQIHNKMETLLGQHGAFVDRIYFCPHHPDKGFPGEVSNLKVECDCRKPKTGMIDRAVRELNIDRGRSWMIGDTTIDLETARRARLKSILVETGYAGLDQRVWARPDFIVPDLQAAVAVVLDIYPRLFALCVPIAESIGSGTIVLMGGHSRSGKSSFASVLRDALSAKGKRALILSADSWLKSADDRGPGVLGRYDMPSLQALVDLLSDISRRPATISIPGYLKLGGQRVESVATLTIDKSDVVILDGTIALALRIPGAVDSPRFHVEIEEDERKRRVVREYRLRGYSDQAAQQIYADRVRDEYPIVEGLGSTARRLRLPQPQDAPRR